MDIILLKRYIIQFFVIYLKSFNRKYYFFFFGLVYWKCDKVLILKSYLQLQIAMQLYA